jgi:hypothetical protein
MRQYKEEIHNHLFECQRLYGGYTGKNLDEIARIFGFNRRTLKRNVEKWSKTDPLFAELRCIGKSSIPLTIEDITFLNQRLRENITCTKGQYQRCCHQTPPYVATLARPRCLSQ